MRTLEERQHPLLVLNNFITDGGTKENCGLISPAWGGWIDWVCEVTKAAPIQCACEKEYPVYLKMRGLCPDSNIDVFWTPQNRKGYFILIGIHSSVTKYDDTAIQWQLEVAGKKQNTQAISDASLHSFLLGKSNWQIVNDTDGENYFLT